MVRVALATAALLGIPLLAAPVLAEDWRVASVGVDNGAVFFIDIDSIQAPKGDMRDAHLFVVMRDGTQPFAALDSMVTFDCVGTRKKSQWVKAYNADGSDFASEGDDRDWIVIKPDSNYEAVLGLVCAGGKDADARRFGHGFPLDAGRKLLADEVAKANQH